MLSRKDKLTPKQQAFVDYYIETLNATEAYKRAGYKAKNDNVAGVEAHRLLKQPKISNAIDKRLKEIASERILSAEEVLERLSAIAIGDVDPKFGEVSIKDMTRALELLGRRHKLFTDRVESDVSMEVEIVLDGFDEEDEAEDNE